MGRQRALLELAFGDLEIVTITLCFALSRKEANLMCYS